jgi:hydrogenase nickel incorporation protein HypA/HybF
MHELGILNHVVRTVDRIAKENGIEQIDHITLEVGDASGCVPAFLEKLFPIAIEKNDIMKDAELNIVIAEGKGMSIKDIGYKK